VDYILSGHAHDMLNERNIPEDWIWRTINNPEWKNVGEDKNIHYFKSIPEHEGRVLRGVVNPHVSPRKVVTVFFDRKARRQK
jgi:hypothetical protein